MQLKFDWMIVLENLHVGILVTDVDLKSRSGPRIIYANRAWVNMSGYDRAEVAGKTPRILQGPKTDRTVVGRLREDLEARRVFHGQTWNYRKSGEPFMMNWHCYAVYADNGKPLYYVAEQRDVTELEAFRMKERLMRNPSDQEAWKFFEVLDRYRQKVSRQLEA
jgi:PAS domain S-box-containing protein